MVSNYAGEILISGNDLARTGAVWSFYQDSNRICGFSADGECTLVTPSVYTLSSCKANISASSTPNQTPDYYDNCQWKTRTHAVTDDTVSFNPNALPDVMPSGATDTCASANANENTLCGFMGLFFAYYGSVGPFTGTERTTPSRTNRTTSSSHNTYDGPVGFVGFNQGNIVSWPQWNNGFAYSGGGKFNPQDAGSSYSS